MASVDYIIGYQVHARVKKTITWNILYFPDEVTVTGNDYVLTYETNTFTLTANATFTIENVTGTNCTTSFNSSTGLLTITNVTGNVTITVTVAGTTLGFFRGGAELWEGGPKYQYVSGGTIYYKNKYNQDTTFTIPSNYNQDTWSNMILLHSTCQFVNVTVTNETSYSTTKITFGQGEYQRNKYTPSSSSPTNANTCLAYGYGPISYTFTDCTGPWIVADIQDAYGPR